MLRDRLGARSCTFSSASESAQQAKLFFCIQQTSSRRRQRGWEKAKKLGLELVFIACLDKILAANRWIHLETSIRPTNHSSPSKESSIGNVRGGGVRGWRRWAIEWKKFAFSFIYEYSVLRYSNEKFRPFFISLDTSDDDDDDDCKASVNRESRSARLFSPFSTSSSSRERTIVRVCGFWLAYFFA